MARLLAALAPVLDQVEYGFELAAQAPAFGDAFALIREAEGVTIIRRGSGWARITLGVNSSLDAVGLTAAVAGVLAERGISANVVAAMRHDHVFVPWEKREDAMTALRAVGRP